MSDILGMTLEEAALKRQVERLQFENERLRARLNIPLQSFTGKALDETMIKPIRADTLPMQLITRADVDNQGYRYFIRGDIMRGRTYDGLHVGFYLAHEDLLQQNKWARAELMRHNLNAVSMQLLEHLDGNPLAHLHDITS